MGFNLYKVKKAAAYIKHYGPDKLAKKALGKLIDRDDYSERFEAVTPDEEELFYERGRSFEKKPLVSILVPVYNPPVEYFREMLLSVMNQTYFNWQLCLVDAGTKKLGDVVAELADGDGRVCYTQIENGGIAENTNAALSMAEGDYIALLDNDDTLSPDALYHMVEEINRTSADCLYSDEDKMDGEGKKHFCPHIKPDFNPQLLRSNNYICHLFMVKTELARRVGGFSKEYDGAQDYDFILKCTEQADKVAHVSRVLYHWRTHESSTSANPLSKLYAYESGKKAIEAHLLRTGIKGSVSMLDDMGFYRVEYGETTRGAGAPEVTVVVTGVKDNDTAQKYFKYLRKNTEYDNLKLCATGELDASRLEAYESEYFCILMCGAKPERRDWLGRLTAEADALGADVIAAKLLVRQSFPIYKKLGRSFIVYSGDDYRDMFGKVHINGGKPGWYKGYFNRNILQQNIEKLPRTAILVRREEFMRLLADGWKAQEGKQYLYEPGVELYK